MSPVEQRAAEQTTDLVVRFMEVFLSPLILLMTAVALLVFVYGGFEYVKNAGNEQGRADGKRHMLFGVIGIFVMVSAYAILRIFAATFGLEGELDSLRV